MRFPIQKWHCMFKHLLISCDDTILTPSKNDDAIQSPTVSATGGVYSMSVQCFLGVI